MHRVKNNRSNSEGELIYVPINVFKQNEQLD